MHFCCITAANSEKHRRCSARLRNSRKIALKTFRSIRITAIWRRDEVRKYRQPCCKRFFDFSHRIATTNERTTDTTNGQKSTGFMGAMDGTEQGFELHRPGAVSTSPSTENTKKRFSNTNTHISHNHSIENDIYKYNIYII